MQASSGHGCTPLWEPLQRQQTAPAVAAPHLPHRARICRSVAGSFDLEGVAIFALVFTFYLYVKVGPAEPVLARGRTRGKIPCHQSITGILLSRAGFGTDTYRGAARGACNRSNDQQPWCGAIAVYIGAGGVHPSLCAGCTECRISFHRVEIALTLCTSVTTYIVYQRLRLERLSAVQALNTGSLAWATANCLAYYYMVRPSVTFPCRCTLAPHLL